MSDPALSGLVATARFDGPVAVIGDVHGASDLLRRLLARLPPDMPVISMGDVGDRGPDTRGVVDQLLGRGALGVRGNHEEWVLRWIRGGGFDPFALHPGMGGSATLASYGVTSREARTITGQWRQVPEAHRDWFLGLPLVLDLTVGDTPYWLLHAGVPSADVLPRGLSPADVVPWLVRHRPETLLWDKSRPQDMLPVDRTVIMGHLRLGEAVDTGSVIAIDTGAGTNRDGRLTAVILPERRFVQVG